MEINVFAARVFIGGILVIGKEGKFPQLPFDLDLDLHTAVSSTRRGTYENTPYLAFPASDL
jgi:hypothetical protein